MKKSRFTEEQIAFALRQAESGNALRFSASLRSDRSATHLISRFPYGAPSSERVVPKFDGPAFRRTIVTATRNKWVPNRASAYFK